MVSALRLSPSWLGKEELIWLNVLARRCMADDPKTTLYQAICTSYSAVNDWRAKLLGFLPLASGAGIFFLLNTAPSKVGTPGVAPTYFLPIGTVGAVISPGLFIFDIRALNLRGGLIKAGRALEREMGCVGQFRQRPHSYLHAINDHWGSIFIYLAVIAGWLFLAFGSAPQQAWVIAGSVWVGGVIVLLPLSIYFAYQNQVEEEREEHQLQSAAKLPHA